VDNPVLGIPGRDAHFRVHRERTIGARLRVRVGEVVKK
jgi:hypothetical protein